MPHTIRSACPYVLLALLGCGGDDEDTGPSKAEMTCAPPHGAGTDTCIEIAAGEKLRLASMLDNTTAIPDTGQPAVSPTIGVDNRRAVEAARAVRPKLLGHDVELVGPDMINLGATMAPNFRENCNNVATAIPKNDEVAAQIVANGKILGVIGPVCSNSGAQTERAFTAAKIVVISPNNQSPSLTAVCPAQQTEPPTPCRPADSFYFRTAPNGTFQAGVLAEYALSKGHTSAVTVDDGTLFGHGVALAFAGAFTGATTNQSPISTAQQMDTAIAAIAASPPNIIYITNTSLAQVRTFISKARDGVAPDVPATTLIAITNAAQSKGLWEPDQGGLGAMVKGVLSSAINMAFASSAEYTGTFLPAYKTASGGEAPINLFHAFAYDGYNVLADAIEKVAIQDGDRLLIPRQALREAVRETSHKGLTSIGTGVLQCAAADSSSSQGDCTPGATAFTVDEITCPPASGSGTCNMLHQPLP